VGFVFTNDRERHLVYWMPSPFRPFASNAEARQAAHTAGLQYIEQLKQPGLGTAQKRSKLGGD
jgi:hypothetical protein